MSRIILSYDDLRALGINLSKHRIWRLEQLGLFPKRVHPSAGRVGWVDTEIRAHIAARIAARDNPPTPVKRPRSPGRPRKQAVDTVAAA
jgi:predicted DNA-binding transcriptional regulator AlpA